MTRDAAVLILAAGAGTRMKSDTPKVLHTLGGRSMLAHAVHAVAGVGPTHLVAIVGKDRERVAPAAQQIGETLGRRVEIAVRKSSAVPATPSAVGSRRCRRTSPVSSSSPPATYRC